MEIYDESLKIKLENFLLEEDEEYVKGRKQKSSFWPSESEKPLFDIYHTWFQTPQTNPIEAEKLIMFSAAKMMELALIGKLQKMGLVKKATDQQRFEFEREGVLVTGYADGIFEDGTPIEVKTFYGDYQARELNAGRPKSGYLKQLAMYMDVLDQDLGKLIYLDRGSGAMYEFDLVRTPDTLKFKSMAIEFDLNDTYKKWAKFYNENILLEKEPDPFECGHYKAKIDEINWSQLSKAVIGAARNGHKVIGTMPEEQWKILYSPWKDLLLERQGYKSGYSETELANIKRITKGYSSKKK